MEFTKPRRRVLRGAIVAIAVVAAGAATPAYALSGTAPACSPSTTLKTFVTGKGTQHFHYVPGYSPFAEIVNTTNVQQTTTVTRNSPTYRSGGSWQGYTNGTTSSISASCV